MIVAIVSIVAIVALPVTALAIGTIARFAYHRGMAAGYIACRLDDIQATLERDLDDKLAAAANGVRRREPHP